MPGAEVPNGSGGAPPSGGSGGAPVTPEPILGSGGSEGGVPAPAARDIEFSTPSQSFRGDLQVEIAANVSNAEIRYTTDGTVPTTSSTAYMGTPLTLTATTQLRAQAFVGGTPSGFSATAIYIARTFDATSELPILLLDGYGGGESTDKKLFLDAAVMVFEPVDGTASLDNLPTLVTRAGYHLRGQSSSTFEQRPYRVEFWDEFDEDLDHPLLGMPDEADWALIPPFYDRSLLRNPLTYSLGEELGLDAPRTAFAEIYVNYEPRALGESDYQGIYWVSETLKNQKNRLDLKQLKATDTSLPEISGGYVMKFEQFAAEEPTISCSGANPIAGMFGGGGGGTCWHSLELADPSPANAEQTAWITQYLQQFHDSLHSAPMGNYAEHIDVESFVDYFLLTELTRNMDAYVRSAYYHKDRDEKLRAGPLWDYNFAYGAGGLESLDPSGGWQVNGGRNVNNWYPRLLTDAAFTSAVKARWQILRRDSFSVSSINARIATLSAQLPQSALQKDSAKWPMSWFIERAGRSTVPIDFPQDPTFEGQLQALRDFISARLIRMDTLVNEL